jgi:hypothetical protein
MHAVHVVTMNQETPSGCLWPLVETTWRDYDYRSKSWIPLCVNFGWLQDGKQANSIIKKPSYLFKKTFPFPMFGSPCKRDSFNPFMSRSIHSFPSCLYRSIAMKSNMPKSLYKLIYYLIWERNQDLQTRSPFWQLLRKTAAFFNSDDPALVKAQVCCPLTRSRDYRYSFIHKSFWQALKR